MPVELEMFEPSACRCDRCRQFCRDEPGYLAPGDLERIAGFVGAEGLNPNFVKRNFEAVQGLAIDVGAESIVVPAIRPKVRACGRCVFLTPDEKCSVHPVRPFGCSRVNACEGGNVPAELAVMQAIAEDEDYLLLWTEIAQQSVIE